MPLSAQSVTIKHFVSKCNFFFHFTLRIASKHEVLILFVLTLESKLLLWNYVTTVICEPVHDKIEMVCATSSVWLDSEVLCPCLPIMRIAKSLIRLCVWPRCGFVRFFPVRGRIARGWKMSMYMHSFPRWASDDFGPVDSRACQIRQTPIIMGSTGPVFVPYCSVRLAVGCSKARTASARARTPSEGAPYETRRAHVRVHAALGQNRKNTQRTGRTHVTIASQEATDFPRTTDSYGSPSLTGWGTPVGFMHAT